MYPEEYGAAGDQNLQYPSVEAKVALKKRRFTVKRQEAGVTISFDDWLHEDESYFLDLVQTSRKKESSRRSLGHPGGLV